MQSQVLANGWMCDSAAAQEQRRAQCTATHHYLRGEDLQRAWRSRASSVRCHRAADLSACDDQALRLAVWDEMRTSFKCLGEVQAQR
jgi:hypothetical protein